MAGSTSIGGPPLAWYALRRHWDKQTTIGTLNLTGILATLFIIPLQWQAGLYNEQILSMALWCILCAVAGILVSIPIVKRINLKLFRIFLIFLIAMSGIILLCKGLLS